MSLTKTKILVANAFFLNNDVKQLKEKYKPYPPLAALYAASLLRYQGYDISLFDAVLADDINEFCNVLYKESPLIVVIYEDDFNFLTKMCLTHVRDMTFKMIDYAKARNTTVIVHSSDAADNPAIYLQRGADFIIYGEAEQTLSEIVEYNLSKKPELPEKIPGVYYLNNDEIYKTPIRKTLRQLDELPQPAWDLIDFDNYRQAWNRKHGYFSVNMVTTRGCPYKCNWCAKPIWGQQYSYHSPEYIAKQLEWLVLNASPDHVWFADDIFGLKKGWIEAFAKRVNQLQIKVPFMIQSRADLIDEKVVKALKQAGCVEVWLGVESGSQSVLDNMEKGISLSQVMIARKLLAEFDIDVGFFIQLGYIEEDIDDIELTRNMIIELKPDNIGVSVSYPLPGTTFYQRVKSQLSDKTHWLESNDLDAVFHSTFKAEFYRLIRDHLHNELQCIGHAGESNKMEEQWAHLMAISEKYRNITPTRINNLLNAAELYTYSESQQPVLVNPSINSHKL